MEERASENGGMKEKMKSFFPLKREKRGGFAWSLNLTSPFQFVIAAGARSQAFLSFDPNTLIKHFLHHRPAVKITISRIGQMANLGREVTK